MPEAGLEAWKPGPESSFVLFFRPRPPLWAATQGESGGQSRSLEKSRGGWLPGRKPLTFSLSPQMNMLMRLQEAANYSSPQSYDSDSNSNSHQDDILDSSLESTL